MKKLKIYLLSLILTAPLYFANAQNGTGERAPREGEIRERREQPYLQEDQDAEYDEEAVEAGRENAKSELNRRYPQADNVEWEYRHNEHIATFDLDGEEHEAHFTPEGTWQRTEITLEEEEVPEAVRRSVEEFEPDANVEGYRAYETAEGTIYEVITEHDNQTITHYYDEQGNAVQPPNYGTGDGMNDDAEYDMEDEEEDEWFDDGEVIYRKT